MSNETASGMTVTTKILIGILGMGVLAFLTALGLIVALTVIGNDLNDQFNEVSDEVNAPAPAP